jgi:hypothetical protein
MAGALPEETIPMVTQLHIMLLRLVRLVIRTVFIVSGHTCVGLFPGVRLDKSVWHPSES